MTFWAEAKQRGFSVPPSWALTRPNGSKRGEDATALFVWQAKERWDTIDRARRAEASRQLLHLEDVPTWRDICLALAALDVDGDGRESSRLLGPAAAAMLHSEEDMTQVPYLSLAAKDLLAESWLEEIGETLSWLLLAACGRAFSYDGGRVISCFGSEGCMFKEIDPSDGDRYLVRAFVNDIPILLCSPELISSLPERADEWLWLDTEDLHRLESGLPTSTGHGLTQAVYWPDRETRIELGSWRIHFGRPTVSSEGVNLILGVARTAAGVTMIEIHLREVGAGAELTLQPLPLRYVGTTLLERIELLEQRLAAAIIAEAARHHGPHSAHAAA